MTKIQISFSLLMLSKVWFAREISLLLSDFKWINEEKIKKFKKIVKGSLFLAESMLKILRKYSSHVSYSIKLLFDFNQVFLLNSEGIKLFNEPDSVLIYLDCLLEIFNTFDGDLTNLLLGLSDQIAELEILMDLFVEFLVLFFGDFRR